MENRSNAVLPQWPWPLFGVCVSLSVCDVNGKSINMVPVTAARQTVMFISRS